ncbi:hypothetical protein vBAbaMD22_134 [Acinetobacter phage vB_AbaM_D22]|nr:hypothetical protein vBAbaMD22_134 [Acinetobacter phage vB_AbaM_D22]
MSYDPHRKTAATIFNKSEDAITDIERRAGKAYNLAKQYDNSDNRAMQIAMDHKKRLEDTKGA